MRLHAMCAAVLAASPALAADEPNVPPLVERFLVEGRLDEGEQALRERIAAQPGDSQAKYGLGIVHVLRAVENLAQNLHRYGLRSQSPKLPFVRLPVPQNPKPEPLDYLKWRAVLQQLIDDLETASASLSAVDDPNVKLTLPVGMVRLDLDGDGTATDDETFWKVFTAVAWRAAKLDENQKRFPIGFDAADVHWMIGYTHLLRAMAEAWLAHDTEEFFNVTAPVFFAGAASPPDVLGREENAGGFNVDQFADAILAVHLMHFEPVEPERMRAARKHLLTMIAESRKVWELALAETDDDREWIPNARQTSLTPLTVTDEIVAGWKQFLDEAEDVLEGRKLIPHWRVKGERGIDLKQVFEEPRTFDLVMWAHGIAALPFVKEGDLVTKETANTLSRTFQGRFVVFAVWFQ
ncbi:MAG: hypothetical protein M3552_02810 [Planctomycetota bacterium]|nr:hypothetical protein [Planctomycetaceae bacterium]MDQ3329578.1 hypothetical protein [Planctomycetota bacterium]